MLRANSQYWLGAILERVDILGVRVSAVDMPAVTAAIDQWIAMGERRYVCVTTAHGLNESQRDIELRRIHNNADLVTPDGMPLVWISRLLGYKHVARVCGPDLLLAVCQGAEQRGYRQFFYGGTPRIVNMLVSRLLSQYPSLQIAGTYAPPFRPLTPEEDSAAMALINESRADIVWVGLGAPKQERWMADHREWIGVPVMIGVGAAFDFHAGVKRRAPVLLQQCGLEWAFRLACEPRRLWRRYLIGNPKFIWLVLGQLFRMRRAAVREA